MKQKITLLSLPLILITTMLHTTTVNAEDTTVYKRYDDEGAVEFSDVKRKEAEEIKVKKIPTYEAPKQKSFTPINKDKSKSDPNPYKLRIVTPANGAAIRVNNGDVSVEVSLEPVLSNYHFLQYELDGKKSEPVSALKYTFKNVNRGPHSVSVSVVTRQGESLQRTEPVSFHLHRTSILHPKPATKNEAPNSITGVATITDTFIRPMPREAEGEVTFDTDASVEEASDDTSTRRTYTITNAGTDQNPRAITGAGTITDVTPGLNDTDNSNQTESQPATESDP